MIRCELILAYLNSNLDLIPIDEPIDDLVRCICHLQDVFTLLFCRRFSSGQVLHKDSKLASRDLMVTILIIPAQTTEVS